MAVWCSNTHCGVQVVLAASDKGRDHVPYRSCKLTHVLKDCLGGNCNTVLVANIWGEAAQLEETLSTCRFAARMSRMTAEVISNIMSEGGARVRQLERWVGSGTWQQWAGVTRCTCCNPQLPQWNPDTYQPGSCFDAGTFNPQMSYTPSSHTAHPP